MAQVGSPDGKKVRLLEGNEIGQVDEIVTVSNAIADAAIAAGHAEEVV